MLVVAFDGVLFDTLPLRASAIADALAAEGVMIDNSAVASLVAARSIAETIRECLSNGVSSNTAIDETTLDLAVLRAERTAADLSSRGAVLNVAVRDKLRRAASVTRIVIRADSRRRDVEPLLALAELDAIVSFVRCSDDAATSSPQSTGHSSLERSYAHIARRMAGNMNLLGESSTIGIALEASEVARHAARTLGFEAPENFSTAALPGTH